jgi:hypothetical protein
VRDDETIWDGATLTGVRRTDADRRKAETWQPPPRPTHP